VTLRETTTPPKNWMSPTSQEQEFTPRKKIQEDDLKIQEDDLEISTTTTKIDKTQNSNNVPQI